MKFVAEKVALGQNFLRVLQLPRQSHSTNIPYSYLGRLQTTL